MNNKLSILDNQYIELLLNLRNDDYTWEDIKSIINDKYEVSYSSSKYRKDYYNVVNNYDDIINIDEDIYIDIENKKEQQRIKDTLTTANALIRRLGREETIKELGIEAAEIMNAKKQLSPVKISKSNSSREDVGILCISDWHYGIEIDNFYNKYNTDIAKKRICQLRDEVIKIVIDNNLKELVVLNLGDLIAGRIHSQLRIYAQIDTISQIMEVSELLAEFITDISSYVNIKYTSVIDNHSRLEPNKKESIQLENLTRITDWYLSKRLIDFIKSNKVVILPNEMGPDISTFYLFNHKIVGVHGDKDKQKTIINKLNTFVQSHFDLVFSAHMHHFSADESNETELFCNGSLMGTDDYANDLRLNSKPSQLLVIVSKDNPSKVIYKIKLD